MKRILPFIGLALLIFSSCEREHDPIAGFTSSETLVVPGEVVFFQNTSHYYERCEWDFDDGYVSTASNPNHYFSEEGVYNVRLAVYNHGNVDYAYIDIEVYETTLEVEVREYYSNDLISNVAITLYDNYNDWFTFYNPVATGTTDRSGVVVFKGLDTKDYFIDAFNQLYNNDQLGQENLDFVQTLPLEYATHNVFTAYVDYDPAGAIYRDGQNKQRVKIMEFKQKREVKKSNNTLVVK